MARSGCDFQSLTLENRDWKETEAMSREIIQFDDAMFETKLDAMVRDKVEQIVNAMPDASGRRDRQGSARKVAHFESWPSMAR